MYFLNSASSFAETLSGKVFTFCSGIFKARPRAAPQNVDPMSRSQDNIYLAAADLSAPALLPWHHLLSQILHNGQAFLARLVLFYHGCQDPCPLHSNALPQGERGQWWGDYLKYSLKRRKKARRARMKIMSRTSATITSIQEEKKPTLKA